MTAAMVVSAGVAVAAAVGSAGAAPQTVTLGSVLGTPSQNICSTGFNCTYVPFHLNTSMPELQVPFDGSVTSFSVNSGSSTGSVKLRVLRPAGGGQYTGVTTSTAEALTGGVQSFTVSLPVRAGDVLALDNDSSALLFDTSDATYLTRYYQPALANGDSGLPDGTTAAPNEPDRNGYRLLLSAVVQQSSTTTTGTTTNTTPPVPPALTSVKQSHRRWREGTKLARFASGSTAPVGTTFRFTVSQPATVRFAFKQVKCGRRCAHGALSYTATVGAHTLRFQGRISRKKRLPPGPYRLTITATNGSGLAATAKLTFTIVKG